MTSQEILLLRYQVCKVCVYVNRVFVCQLSIIPPTVSLTSPWSFSSLRTSSHVPSPIWSKFPSQDLTRGKSNEFTPYGYCFFGRLGVFLLSGMFPDPKSTREGLWRTKTTDFYCFTDSFGLPVFSGPILHFTCALSLSCRILTRNIYYLTSYAHRVSEVLRTSVILEVTRS
ncbi:hypothetical protein L218DRAFT_35185 [Marasmius fiardii PR-910]|nr:hypothetical protein L218DRAFT_35185 [Marasmius fiardii PR-910]